MTNDGEWTAGADDNPEPGRDVLLNVSRQGQQDSGD